MMRLFNFNPDKMNAYVDSEDKNVSMYVESHGVIRISESYFEYTAASDGGIPIERFLNYTDASGYDLYDAIKAAEYFANKVRAISSYVFGGDASIGISDIGYRDGVLYIEYSYYYDNIPVEYANGRAAMRFEIEKDKFVGVSLDPVSISPSGKTMHSFSQKMIINAYSGRIDDLPEYPDTRLVYLIDEAAGKERCADWEIVYYRP